MWQAVRKNFGLKVLALALSVAAWAYLRFAGNPALAARFDQQLSVPVTVSGLRPGHVVRLADRNVLVTLASQPNGSPVRTEQVRAVVNLGLRPAGVYDVPVQVVAPGVEVKSLEPASTTVEVDRIDTQSVPISVAYVGDRRDLVVAGLRVTPADASLRGTATALARVEAVRIDVPFASATASAYDAMLRPAAFDAHGQPVTGVTISPSLVRVRARFVKPGAAR